MKRNGKRVAITKELAERIETARNSAGISINEIHRRTGMQINTYNAIQNLKQNTISRTDLDELSIAMQCGRAWLETGEGSINDKDYLMNADVVENECLADIFEYETNNVFAKFNPLFFGEDAAARYFMRINTNDTFVKNTTLPQLTQSDVLIIKEANALERSGIYLIKFNGINLLKAIMIDIQHDAPVVYMNSDHGEFVLFDKERFRIVGIVACTLKRI